MNSLEAKTVSYLADAFRHDKTFSHFVVIGNEFNIILNLKARMPSTANKDIPGTYAKFRGFQSGWRTTRTLFAELGLHICNRSMRGHMSEALAR